MQVETERNIEARGGRELVKRGYLVYKFTSPEKRGVPDRLVISPDGQVFFIEFKRPDGRLSPIQIVQIERIRRNNGVVHVISSHSEMDALLQELQQ
jgi:hypothetical protein